MALVVVIGAGGHGREVAAYLTALAATDNVQFAGFIDEELPPGPAPLGRILGGFHDLALFVRARAAATVFFITAAGDNTLRRHFVQAVGALDLSKLRPWTVVHPSAVVGPEVEIGPGTCLAPGSIVTTRSRIGAHCILNVNASVSHDCVVGDFCNINPGAVICGNVRLDDGCYIGAGAVVIDHVTIGANTVVGAGAVVTEDLPAAVTAVGVPAKVIRRRNPNDDAGS